MWFFFLFSATQPTNKKKWEDELQPCNGRYNWALLWTNELKRIETLYSLLAKSTKYLAYWKCFLLFFFRFLAEADFTMGHSLNAFVDCARLLLVLCSWFFFSFWMKINKRKYLLFKNFSHKTQTHKRACVQEGIGHRLLPHRHPGSSSKNKQKTRTKTEQNKCTGLNCSGFFIICTLFIQFKIYLDKHSVIQYNTILSQT